METNSERIQKLLLTDKDLKITKINVFKKA